MSTETDWLSDVYLVDHHCYGVIEEPVDRATFEDLITESDAPAPDGATFFDTQLGFAIRRDCAPILDLPSSPPPKTTWRVGPKSAARPRTASCGERDR